MEAYGNAVVALDLANAKKKQLRSKIIYQNTALSRAEDALKAAKILIQSLTFSLKSVSEDANVVVTNIDMALSAIETANRAK